MCTLNNLVQIYGKKKWKKAEEECTRLWQKLEKYIHIQFSSKIAYFGIIVWMCQSETESPGSHNPELFIRVPQTRAQGRVSQNCSQVFKTTFRFLFSSTPFGIFYWNWNQQCSHTFTISPSTTAKAPLKNWFFVLLGLQINSQSLEDAKALGQKSLGPVNSKIGPIFKN